MSADLGIMRERARDALRDVVDPELGIDVVELGLVYDIVVTGSTIDVDLAMTSAACPLGDAIASEAAARLREIDGVTDVHVYLVHEPPWTPDRMSPRARALLGWAT